MIYVDVVSEIPSGVTEILSKQQYFTLSPNPAHSSFTITLNPQSTIRNSQLAIYNSLGEKFFSKPITGNTEPVDCSRFPKGIYFVHLSNEAQRWIKKVVVE